MRIVTKVETTKTIINNYTCDRCKQDCTYPRLLPNYDAWEMGVVLQLSASYGSKFDLLDESFDLCDDCAGLLYEWLGTKPYEQ